MIRLIRPYINYDEVEQSFREVFASGMFTRGNNVDAFRQELVAYTGASHAFLTTSATTALWLCLKYFNIGVGDEVLVSDYSFPATANVVEDLGATPIFVDVSLDTFNMLPSALEQSIGPRTKAVIFVDALGNPDGLHAIADICRARGVPLIEDAACAIGSSERGVRCGAIADLTCFSFHPRKLLTTGEGGAITTRHAEWSDWFERKLSHGAQGMQGPGLDFVDYGYNFRLSELQAVMGRVQLAKLNNIVLERNAIRSEYERLLVPLGFKVQQLGQDVVHNVQSLVFRVPDGVVRDELIVGLREDGIEATIGTYCLSGTSYYRRRYAQVQQNALQLQKDTITLPCYAGVDVERVCEAIAARCA